MRKYLSSLAVCLYCENPERCRCIRQVCLLGATSELWVEVYPGESGASGKTLGSRRVAKYSRHVGATLGMSLRNRPGTPGYTSVASWTCEL